MKSNLFFILGSLLLVSSPAFAGPLYGTVRIGSEPAVGVAIHVACPGFAGGGQPNPSVVIDAVTDARGSYSVRVPADGRCQMRVQRANQSGAPFEVYVSNNPLRFDFTVDGAMNRVR